MEVDKSIIDCLADDCIVRRQVKGVQSHFRSIVKDFEHTSGVPFGFYAKEPSDLSLWYGFMMMVALAMTEIEDEEGTQVINLLRAFVYDENYSEYAQGLAWLLFGPLRYAVSCGYFVILFFVYLVLTFRKIIRMLSH